MFSGPISRPVDLVLSYLLLSPIQHVVLDHPGPVLFPSAGIIVPMSQHHPQGAIEGDIWCVLLTLSPLAL